MIVEADQNGGPYEPCLGQLLEGDAGNGTSSNSRAASPIAITSSQVMEPLLSLSLTVSILSLTLDGTLSTRIVLQSILLMILLLLP